MWWKDENHHRFPPLYLLSFWGMGAQGFSKPDGTSILHGVLFCKFFYTLFGTT